MIFLSDQTPVIHDFEYGSISPSRMSSLIRLVSKIQSNDALVSVYKFKIQVAKISDVRICISYSEWTSYLEVPTLISPTLLAWQSADS